MGILDSLLGDDDSKAEYGDFVARLTDGSPADDKVSDDEARARYDDVKDQLDRDEYVTSAEQALGQMHRDERSAVGEQLRRAADEQGIDRGDDDGSDDPGAIGGVVGKLFDNGNVDSVLHNLPGGLSRGMLGGIAGMALKKFF